jgi:hypothetical protein
MKRGSRGKKDEEKKKKEICEKGKKRRMNACMNE